MPAAARGPDAFGWDVLAPFDMTFRRMKEGWKHLDPIDLESDFGVGAEGRRRLRATDDAGQRLVLGQGARTPHKISDDVWPELRDQVKVSTYLRMKTDRDELLMLGEVPNRIVPWRAFTAVLDTRPSSGVLSVARVLILDRREKEIRIDKGTPLFRLTLHTRKNYRSKPMTDAGFDTFFTRGQEWLRKHARGVVGDTADIRGAYVKQQRNARFL
jgi:hypothetical protein